MRVLLIAFVGISIVGCAGTYKKASHVASQCYIGMSIQEFKSIAGTKATLESMESGYTIFRVNDYDAWSGAYLNSKFFYFDSNGKLVKLDGGVPVQDRQQIEIINR